MNPHKEKKRHTLMRQITLVFLTALVVSILGVTILNGIFLEKYYISRKVKVLREAMHSLNALDTDALLASSGEDEEADAALIPEELNRSSLKNNLSWVILNEENSTGISWGENKGSLRGKLFGYVYELDHDISDGRIIEEGESFTIQQTQDHFTEMNYVECWGWLENGCYFLIRTPVESIRESVAISNRFYLFVGIATAVLCGLLVFFLTRRLTRPIRELTELSQQMAGLNFEKRYESSVGNEIDVLGESFNRMSDELEHTISELKTANLELQKDIENKIRIDERRKEFLDNVSHELKTPIALIQGYAEGLKENISDDPESREFYCDVIMDESAKMNKLVKNLLTLNQLESGKDAVMMERFELTALIGGVLQSMEILLRQSEARVVFEPEEKVYVWADEFKTEEVLTNYVSNAIHHLEGEKVIEIRLEREEKRIRITVFNTGKPIPEEDLPNLWNKFYKVDKARTREYGGSGIGLSIVKAVMDSMKQEYGVKNYNNGVAFYFTLEAS